MGENLARSWLGWQRRRFRALDSLLRELSCRPNIPMASARWNPVSVLIWDRDGQRRRCFCWSTPWRRRLDNPSPKLPRQLEQASCKFRSSCVGAIVLAKWAGLRRAVLGWCLSPWASTAQVRARPVGPPKFSLFFSYILSIFSDFFSFSPNFSIYYFLFPTTFRHFF